MTSTAARFQLPVLAPLRPLTDGTDIPPPPPDSPVEDARAARDTARSRAAPPLAALTTTTAATAPAADLTPVSPASARQGSIRKFLSRKSLKDSYMDGANASQDHLARPASPSTFSLASTAVPSSLTKKKSGSWFRKLGGHASNPAAAAATDNRRASMMIFAEKAPVVEQPAARGPPPPRLPELGRFRAKVDESSATFGDDMFKNIK